MATSAYARYEDATLRKVFAITLDASRAEAEAQPPIVCLEALVKVGPPRRRRHLPSFVSIQPAMHALSPAFCLPSPLNYAWNSCVQELEAEAAAAATPDGGEAVTAPLLLSRDTIERALMARLRCVHTCMHASVHCYV